jgi:hypothetical protein
VIIVNPHAGPLGRPIAATADAGETTDLWDRSAN